MSLVVSAYESTWAFPKDEIYGLRLRIRRAALPKVRVGVVAVTTPDLC